MRRWVIILFIIAILAGVSACSKDSSGPVSAIESYNQALVKGQSDLLVTLSCADWEADAQNELASFAAVKVGIEDMSCRETDKDEDIVLIACTGKIIANYGNEVLEINLADRFYQAVLEAGEWRMCGYR
jgi:hypothetical protein